VSKKKMRTATSRVQRVLQEIARGVCYNPQRMHSRCVKLVVVLVLAAHLAGPLFETVDRWDSFPQKPHDIVLSVTSALTFLAAGFALGIVLRRLMRARRSFSTSVFHPGPVVTNLARGLFLRQPISVHSPPLSLRI
jgi:hypothetical protein